MSLEVHLGARRLPAGEARETPEKYEDMRQALRKIAELTTAGLFALRRDAMWEFELHYESPEDWTEFHQRPNCGGVDADPELLDAALVRTDGRIVLTEENLAQVYERRSRTHPD